ncbi:RimK family protein [Gilvimarinus sp. F26214L]|uniref:RimK family protein n=1 Tax=Gilvimarinus sp. DZF01 TaxID=3461371 RepID=UPI0040459513
MSNIYLVLDDLSAWRAEFPADAVISFDTYLKEHPIKGEKKTRIINLCNTDRYLSKGYYCSLLAEARGHKVLPPVNTLNDLGSQQLYLLQVNTLLAQLNKLARDESSREDICFKVFFGKTEKRELRLLARKLFERFPCPVLEVVLVWQGSWQIRSINPFAFEDLNAEESGRFVEALEKFTQSLWRSPRKRKASRWDMAILINPHEKLPPSDSGALKRMERAATKVGFHVEFIGPADYARLSEFDALFIRETTGIDHHTYHFSRKAEIEGLVVMDDPTSILRCCNKVFLQDAFTYSGVPTPKTRIVSSMEPADLDALEEFFGYPMVLKIPNGSFSVGVSKAESREQLREVLGELLSKSALVIAQEFLFTEFDWRIGILNHRPLYACRYYMAKGHWQIYDHGADRIGSGGSETLPTYEVPRVVLNAALKAARIIGDGIYGIDIKQQGNKVYVIEVNDNPSLEHGVEDAFIGDELYMQIMSEFARRLENRGR